LPGLIKTPKDEHIVETEEGNSYLVEYEDKNGEPEPIKENDYDGEEPSDENIMETEGEQNLIPELIDSVEEEEEEEQEEGLEKEDKDEGGKEEEKKDKGEQEEKEKEKKEPVHDIKDVKVGAAIIQHHQLNQQEIKLRRV
jgi:hypothetical protein